jgi:hypothetical protein
LLALQERIDEIIDTIQRARVGFVPLVSMLSEWAIVEIQIVPGISWFIIILFRLKRNGPIRSPYIFEVNL